MAIFEIDTPDDPRLADYAVTSDPAMARDRGLFVAEGRFVVSRLIEDRRHVVCSLLLSDVARRELGRALAALDPAVPVYVAPSGAFVRVTGYNIHRGCLALASRPPAVDAAGLAGAAHLAVVLEGIANPDNVGGIFRNAAAFGGDAVFLDPSTCDPLYRKAIRTSMGATLRVPFARLDGWPAAIATLRRAGLRVVALTPRPAAQSIDVYASQPRRGRLALLVGNEGAGLSDAATDAADERVRIPIAPDVDSLNVAVAAGIALARLTPLAHLW